MQNSKKVSLIERMKKRSKLGFSLVELIVVIAIMAILTAILAPTMLQYVEKTRAAKDNSAMGEVTNAVKIAMADQNVYDELLMVESGKDAKVPSGYADAADETAAAFAGEQRGVIITFKPEANNKQSVINLADGIINGASAGDTSVTEGDDGKLGALTAGDGKYHLITELENICGKEITLVSQTYRNSDYTVFIKMGTLGAADSSISIKGEWNGTNLPKATTGNGGGEGDSGGGNEEPVPQPGGEVKPGEALPDGAYYVRTSTSELLDAIPAEVADGDIFVCGDYMYGYSPSMFGYNGWRVVLATEDNVAYFGLASVVSSYNYATKTQTSYDDILILVGDKQIEDIDSLFNGCENLIVAPAIPSSVTNMNDAFAGCTSLTTAPRIPENVEIITYAFNGCTSLMGEIKINATPSSYAGCFWFVDMSKITITGELTNNTELLNALCSTGNNWTNK